MVGFFGCYDCGLCGDLGELLVFPKSVVLFVVVHFVVCGFDFGYGL